MTQASLDSEAVTGGGSTPAADRVVHPETLRQIVERA